MVQEAVFRKFISVGQKTTADSSPYGQGFNYTVEAGFALSPGFDREACLKAFGKALAVIDHKALGVDVDLGVEPSSAELCLYLKEQIRKSYPPGVTSLKLYRGDGLAVALDSH